MKHSIAFLTSISLVLLTPGIALGEDTQAGDTETSVLKVFDGDAAIVIDKVSRQDGRLTVSTDSVGRARFEMEIELTSDEMIAKARIRVWPEGKNDPEMDVTAEIMGKWLLWGYTGGSDPAMMKVPKNTHIYLPPSPTAIEQIIRRALALRGKRNTVSMKFWTPYQTEEVQEAEVRFPAPGTAEFDIFESTYTLSIDDEGNILSGRVEPVGNTIIRE